MICVNTGHFTCHNFKPISIKDSSSDIYLTAVVVQRKLLEDHSILCHSKNWGIHYEYMIFLKSGTLYTRQKKKSSNSQCTFQTASNMTYHCILEHIFLLALVEVFWSYPIQYMMLLLGIQSLGGKAWLITSLQHWVTFL